VYLETLQQWVYYVARHEPPLRGPVTTNTFRSGGGQTRDKQYFSAFDNHCGSVATASAFFLFCRWLLEVDDQVQ
jgi:hypothetical protein